jgi:hypothetical protein
MEFYYLFAASQEDYSEIFSHYQTRELTQEEIADGIYGECVITFSSLEELIHFEDEVGDIVICDRRRRDNSFYKAIIIYDYYLE